MGRYLLVRRRGMCTCSLEVEVDGCMDGFVDVCMFSVDQFALMAVGWILFPTCLAVVTACFCMPCVYRSRSFVTCQIDHTYDCFEHRLEASSWKFSRRAQRHLPTPRQRKPLAREAGGIISRATAVY